jgi:phage terminase large subunit-like protein
MAALGRLIRWALGKPTAVKAAVVNAVEKAWVLSARPAQLPPDGDWRVWVLMGGRGAGKTRAGAEWVRSLVESGRARRIALVGPTLHDVREVMIEGVSGLKAVASVGMRPVHNVSRRRVEWPNGAVAHVFSAEDPDSLRGPQFDAAWCDEIGAWARDEKTWETLMFALRMQPCGGAGPRVMATTTPRARKLVIGLVGRAATLPPLGKGRSKQAELATCGDHFGQHSPDEGTSTPISASPKSDLPLAGEGVRSPGVVLTRAATRENAANLAPGFLAAMAAQYAGTRTGRQELEGELIADPEGALFTREMIERARVRLEELAPLPSTRSGGTSMFERVVVAVDPPAGAGPDASACGIIAAGIRQGVVYVLKDASVHGMRPLEWAGRAVALARTVGAGTIVAEANQGGEMVKQVLELAGAKETSRVQLEHASRSKFDRAAPLSGLYDKQLIRHAGVFRELEDEMCAVGAEGEGGGNSPAHSPDRLDALVWAVGELRRVRVMPRVESLWE